MTARKRPATAAITGTTYGPTDGGNVILAAWRGLVNLFGAHAEGWEISSLGITAKNVSLGEGFNSDEILAPILSKNPRLDLIESFPIIQGQTPEPFTNPHEMTQWMTKFYGGAEEGRSPQIVKDRIAAYKADNGFAVARGRPRKTVAKIDFTNLSAEALAGVPEEEQLKLKALLDSMHSETTPEE